MEKTSQIERPASWFFEEISTQGNFYTDFNVNIAGQFTSDETEQFAKDLWFAEVEYEFNDAPDGKFGRIIPHTYLAIKIPRFFRGILQTILSAYWMASSGADNLSVIVGGGWATLDGLEKLSQSFRVLDENAGEYCVYQSTLESATATYLTKGKRVETSEVWEQHSEIRSICPVSTCIHHENGCKLSQSKFELLLAVLQEKELISFENNSINVRW